MFTGRRNHHTCFVWPHASPGRSRCFFFSSSQPKLCTFTCMNHRAKPHHLYLSLLERSSGEANNMLRPCIFLARGTPSVSNYRCHFVDPLWANRHGATCPFEHDAGQSGQTLSQSLQMALGKVRDNQNDWYLLSSGAAWAEQRLVLRQQGSVEERAKPQDLPRPRLKESMIIDSNKGHICGLFKARKCPHAQKLRLAFHLAIWPDYPNSSGGQEG